MTLSDRDKKLLLALIPIVLIVGYWFLLLAPKREQASTAGTELAKQEQRLEAARASAGQAQGAKTDFASDYGEIVRLGKAIPASVDMPSLLVQLELAASGTGIRFTRIATGTREPSAAAPAPAPSGTGGAAPSNGSNPADSGGAPAQSAPGQTAEAANTTAQNANSAATESGVDPADTQTSTSSGSGLPVGGGAAAGAQAGSTSTSPAGLETVPLELEFVGDFFNLASFFHSVKRFVNVANQQVVVGGRLVTIEGVRFSSDPELFPRIKAELDATVYLSPKSEGTTAGATPQGPAPAAGDAGQSTPASDSSTPTASTAPAATATP